MRVRFQTILFYLSIISLLTLFGVTGKFSIYFPLNKHSVFIGKVVKGDSKKAKLMITEFLRKTFDYFASHLQSHAGNMYLELDYLNIYFIARRLLKAPRAISSGKTGERSTKIQVRSAVCNAFFPFNPWRSQVNGNIKLFHGLKHTFTPFPNDMHYGNSSSIRIMCARAQNMHFYAYNLERWRQSLFSVFVRHFFSSLFLHISVFSSKCSRASNNAPSEINERKREIHEMEEKGSCRIW